MGVSRKGGGGEGQMAEKPVLLLDKKTHQQIAIVSESKAMEMLATGKYIRAGQKKVRGAEDGVQ